MLKTQNKSRSLRNKLHYEKAGRRSVGCLKVLRGLICIHYYHLFAWIAGLMFFLPSATSFPSRPACRRSQCSLMLCKRMEINPSLLWSGRSFPASPTSLRSHYTHICRNMCSRQVWDLQSWWKHLLLLFLLGQCAAEQSAVQACECVQLWGSQFADELLIILLTAGVEGSLGDSGFWLGPWEPDGASGHKKQGGSEGPQLHDMADFSRSLGHCTPHAFVLSGTHSTHTEWPATHRQ